MNYFVINIFLYFVANIFLWFAIIVASGFLLYVYLIIGNFVRRKFSCWGIKKVPKQIELLPWFSFLVCFPVLIIICISKLLIVGKYMTFVMSVLVVLFSWFILTVIIDITIIILYSLYRMIIVLLYSSKKTSNCHSNNDTQISNLTVDCDSENVDSNRQTRIN
jgi:hypothetical protein